MKKYWEKIMALLLTMVLAVGLLAACGSENPAEADTSEEVDDGADAADAGESSEGKTGKGITIRLLTRMSGADGGTQLLKDVIAEFEEKYPDITIQDESINDSTGFDNQFKTDIASGNVADIIQWPGISIMKEYAESGVFLDLSEQIENDADVKANVDATLLDMMELSAVGVPGIYALPINNQMEVFYYNTELFEEAGIESVPETWDDFFEACEKLEDIGVIPWTLGASNAWRIVHIQTGLLYRLCGVEKASQLGSGEASWTDPDVVESIAFIQELAERGAFGTDYQGIDYETEKARFNTGETAMTFDGSWRIDETSDIQDKVSTFRMPVFSDKMEYADHDIAYPSQLELSGALKDDPEKLEYVWELATMFVSKSYQERYLYEVANIPVRTDIDVDESKLNPLMAELLNFKENDIKTWGSDAWAYDTNASLENILGDALVGALTGMTAEEAAEQIQTQLEAAK